MYVPKSFAETDKTKLHEFMSHFSFATLVSDHRGEPLASHLPILLEKDIGAHGRLIGHMAKANFQWESAAGGRVLVIFHGPHAYISPGWIDSRNIVPTWNYATVHAYGTLRTFSDHDRLLAVVTRTVEWYESNRDTPWTISNPEPEFINKLLQSIVGFEIDIDRLEGKWKLNQNHPIERREQIESGLRSTGRHEEQLVADLMREARQQTT